MKSLANAGDRAQLAARIETLTFDRPARWGKMDCLRMLAHCADAMRMAIGELEVRPKKTPLRFFPLKQLFVYVLPFPRGAPTAKELLARPAVSIEREKTDLKELLDRAGNRAEDAPWPVHPAFGPLTARGWRALGYRHLDHHLRQFGA